jgi:hypothetical protein
MKYSFLLALILSAQASAQCFSPACPDDYPPAPIQPVGPTELCLPTGCNPVNYTEINGFTVAESVLPITQYPVLGWSGPCFDSVCPDIRNQAFGDLEMNAKRANRAQRFGE